MKHFLLALLAGGTILFSACKKNTSAADQSAGPPSISPGKNITVAISKNDVKTINSRMKSGGLRTSEEFRGFLDSLTKVSSTASRKVHVTDDDDVANYYAAYDELDYGTELYEYPLPKVIGGDWDGTYVQSNYQTDLYFPIRGNTVWVLIPFMYTWGHPSGNTITNIRPSPGRPVEIRPTGAYWGEVTQGSGQYVNGYAGFINDPNNGNAGIIAYADAQEKRTQITSVTGKAKISTEANIEVFKIGAELEAGFTIQSVGNIYNQYSMTATGGVTISQNGGIAGGPPTTHFNGTITCVDYGILRNY